MQNKERKLHIAPPDLAALLIGLAVFAFFAVTLRYGVGVHDEAYYYTVPHRILAGDRLLIDEWHLTQLSLLPDIAPMFLYMKIAGSAEGVILFFRYLYLLVNAVFYGYIYRKLRGFGIWGLAAAVSFCILLQGAVTGFNYHSVACMAVMHALLILCFAQKTPGPGKLLLAGAVLAVGILSQPFLIFVYALYALLFFVRQALRKRIAETAWGGLFRGQTFLFVTLGAFLIFVLLMALLFAEGTLSQLPAVFPHLIKGKEYNSGSVLDFTDILNGLRLYGFGNMTGLALCAAAALSVRGYIKKKPAVLLRLGLCGVALLFLAGAFLTAGVKSARQTLMNDFFKVLQSYALPLMLFAPTPCLLCRNKAPDVHALWITGLLFSFFVDRSSQSFIAGGGRISAAGGILGMGRLFAELKEDLTAEGAAEKGRALLKRTAAAAAAVGLILPAVWSGGYALAGGLFEPIEYISAGYAAPNCGETVAAGPLRGIRTTARIRELYDASLEDLDRIRSEAGEGPVLVYGCSPYMYLYLDKKYATYSSYYLNEPERLLDYWRLLPERQPKRIYVPMFDYDFTLFHNTRQRAEEIRQYFTAAKIVNGKAGYLIEVTGEFRTP